MEELEKQILKDVDNKNKDLNTQLVEFEIKLEELKVELDKKMDAELETEESEEEDSQNSLNEHSVISAEEGKEEVQNEKEKGQSQKNLPVETLDQGTAQATESKQGEPKESRTNIVEPSQTQVKSSSIHENNGDGGENVLSKTLQLNESISKTGLKNEKQVSYEPDLGDKDEIRESVNLS